MRKLIWIAFGGVLLASAAYGPQSSWAQGDHGYILRPSVIAAGGQISTGGGYTLAGTLGQASVGTAVDGGYVLSGGVRLHHDFQIAQDETFYLPLIWGPR